jgi:N-acetyl-anhydromuramyl-L-alanine amidase AmpD
MKEIFIHCSAKPNGRHHTAEDIHRWHLERGWDGIGYHYVITVKGQLQVGRPEYWQGAHVRGHNKDSIGICMIGTDKFNLDQWSILENLVRKLIIKYPEAKVRGHNEVSDKKCPGFDVQWWLQNKVYTGEL